MPFFDGSLETLERVNALMVPLALGSLVAAVCGRARRLTPVLYLDFWRVDLPATNPSTTNDVVWSTSNHSGCFVLAALLAVLLYGVAADIIWPSASSGETTVLIVGLVIATGAAAVAGFVLAMQSSSSCMTLAYTLVLAVWLTVLPLAFSLREPWNLVLVLVLIVPSSILLTVFCTRWHTSRRLAGVEPSDLRLTASETRFPRHMSRWLLFALYSGLVYAIAFIVDEPDNFDDVLWAVALMQVGFAFVVLAWTLACSGACCGKSRSKVVEVFETSTRPAAQQTAGASSGMLAVESKEMHSDPDDNDAPEPFLLGGSRAAQRRK